MRHQNYLILLGLIIDSHLFFRQFYFFNPQMQVLQSHNHIISTILTQFRPLNIPPTNLLLLISTILLYPIIFSLIHLLPTSTLLKTRPTHLGFRHKNEFSDMATPISRCPPRFSPIRELKIRT
uniref:Uncharacterized protein n=1 Tax=Opuntia streptacantha TaxID=393608 RepID=A0A7C8YK93_OPUST